MRNALRPLILVACATLVANVHGQAPSAPIDAREKVLLVARGLIGTQEATGRNDGPVVEAILRSVGLSKGDPYCAAFNYWCYSRAGLARFVPQTGWSPAWVNKPTWTRAAGGRTPLPGDSWGIYFPSKGRVAHTGLVEKWGKEVVITIEANTSPEASAGSDADRNGDGIWRKRRLVKAIYAARNWLGD